MTTLQPTSKRLMALNSMMNEVMQTFLKYERAAFDGELSEENYADVIQSIMRTTIQVRSKHKLKDTKIDAG